MHKHKYPQYSDNNEMNRLELKITRRIIHTSINNNFF